MGKRTYACQDCGETFVHPNPRGCLPLRCEPCNRLKWKRRKRGTVRPTTGWCETCQRGFVVPRSGPIAPRYCSPRCARWWPDRRFDLQRLKRCAVCEQRFIGNTTGDIFCSKRCSMYHRGHVTTLADRCRIPWIECPACSRWFTSGSHRRYGAQKCADCRRDSRRDNERRKNYRRRKAPSGSPYTLREIARRDGMRCHLCRRRVDMRLSGMNPMGPTVDHLVPISEGGVDGAENVRLAHRSCNVARNTGGTVQLLLVG